MITTKYSDVFARTCGGYIAYRSNRMKEFKYLDCCVHEAVSIETFSAKNALLLLMSDQRIIIHTVDSDTSIDITTIIRTHIKLDHRNEDIIDIYVRGLNIYVRTNHTITRIEFKPQLENNFDRDKLIKKSESYIFYGIKLFCCNDNAVLILTNDKYLYKLENELVFICKIHDECKDEITQIEFSDNYMFFRFTNGKIYGTGTAQLINFVHKNIKIDAVVADYNNIFLIDSNFSLYHFKNKNNSYQKFVCQGTCIRILNDKLFAVIGLDNKWIFVKIDEDRYIIINTQLGFNVDSIYFHRYSIFIVMNDGTVYETGICDNKNILKPLIEIEIFSYDPVVTEKSHSSIKSAYNYI